MKVLDLEASGAYLCCRLYFYPLPQEEPSAAQYPEIKYFDLDSCLLWEKEGQSGGSTKASRYRALDSRT